MAGLRFYLTRFRESLRSPPGLRRSLRLQDWNTLLMSSYFSFWLSSKFSCFRLGSVNFRSCCALSFRGCMRVKPMAEVPTIVEVTFAVVQHRPLPVFYLGLLHGGHPSFVYFVHSTSHIVSNWSQLFYRSQSRPIPKMLPGIKLGREDFLPSDWFLARIQNFVCSNFYIQN